MNRNRSSVPCGAPFNASAPEMIPQGEDSAYRRVSFLAAPVEIERNNRRNVDGL